MFRSLFQKISNWFKREPKSTSSNDESPVQTKLIPSDIENQIDAIVHDRLINYKNLIKFNPNVIFWQSVIKAMAFAESSFNVLSRYEEDLGLDAVTGKKNTSEGLLQLSYQDAKYHGCKFDWAIDKSKSALDKTKTIFNVHNNIDGGLIILDKLMLKHGHYIYNTGNYWAVLKPENKRHNVFVNKFNYYMSQSVPAKEPIKVPPTKIQLPLPIHSDVKRLKIAFIEGHGDKAGSGIDTGSTHYNGKSELTYTKEVTKLLLEKKHLIKHEIEIFTQFPSVGDCAKKVIAWKPDLSFELHTNAYNGKAKGCQSQVLSNDPASFKFAKLFAEAFCKKFGRVLRDSDGVLEMGRKERGIYNLTSVEALPASVLCEPFFGDNKSDYVSVEDYVSFWIEFINSL